jgi:hypothetical protein
MAAPYCGLVLGGEDHQPNRRHPAAQRGSCVGRIEYKPPPSFVAKLAPLAPSALDSTPRRPLRSMSPPPRPRATSTTDPSEVPAPVDNTCHGYMNPDQQVSGCTQSSRDMLESTRGKTGRKGSALDRFQQFQIMESNKSGGRQEDSNERAHSTSSDMFQTTKWSASTTRDTAHASPPQRPNRRMSVGAGSFPIAEPLNTFLDHVENGLTNQDGRTLDVSGRSSHSNPDANRGRGRRRNSKNSDINFPSSSRDSSTRSSRSNPDVLFGDSHPRWSKGRKRTDQRGNAALGQRQDGWNSQAPHQTADPLTLNRLQGLAKMQMVREQSKMSLMSKESAFSKESTISKDSQASREYGNRIPWWS